MRAQAVMTHDPAVVTPDESVARAAELMRDLDVGIVPVVSDRDSMRLVGVITDRDIAVSCVAARHETQCRVAEHMTKDALETVAPRATTREVVQAMTRRQLRRIPVVAEGGRLVGIIAQADLALKLGPIEPEEIEELVEWISRPATQAARVRLAVPHAPAARDHAHRAQAASAGAGRLFLL